MKENLLELTSKLKENINNSNIDECTQLLVKIQEIVEKINNEQITKKFNGIFSDFIGERETTIDATIEHIKHFEQTIQTSIENEKIEKTAERLNSELDEKYKVYAAIENLKAAIQIGGSFEVESVYVENFTILSDYAKTLSKEDQEKIYKKADEMAKYVDEIGNPVAKMTETEREGLTKILDDLAFVIDEIKENEKTKASEQTVEENYEDKPIPESKEDIKKEMDEILGDSIFAGIEKFDFELKGLELDNDTKEQIKTLQNECELLKLSNNDKKIEELREEIYLLAYPKFFTIGNLSMEKLGTISKNQYKRINVLLSAYDKIVKKEKEERTKKKADGKLDGSEKENVLNAIKNLKESINLGKNTLILSHLRALKVEIEKIENIELKEKMFKKLDNIQKRINGVGKLTDGTKEQALKELEELEAIYNKKVTEKDPNKNPKPTVPVDPTPTKPDPINPELVTPVENKKTKKKKGKKVVATKSAEPFYKRHKKGLLIAFGITLLAASLPHLLPAIMYLHSALWGVAVASGVPANIGLPVILHDLNTIIGAKIGASYAASSGIWTLANGAALNATAAEAGILSVLGRLTTIALPFAGAKLAIKNAIKVAKEKIKQRKEKIEKEHPERKGHFFKNIKDYTKNKFNTIKETVTTKYTEAKENISSKYTEIKENHEKKKEEKSLEKERRREERELELARYIKNPYLSRKTNGLIQMLYDNEIIEQDLFDELKEIEDETEAYEMIKKALKEEKGKGSK